MRLSKYPFPAAAFRRGTKEYRKARKVLADQDRMESEAHAFAKAAWIALYCHTYECRCWRCERRRRTSGNFYPYRCPCGRHACKRHRGRRRAA